MEITMGNNKRRNDNHLYGKCEICLRYIPVEYYFSVGDLIDCYECGTVYTIESKKPIRLKMADDHYTYSDNDYPEEMYFDDY